MALSKYKDYSVEDLAKRPNTFAEPAWWKESVIFQVWPASFNDTNGDGIGDIEGMIAKVDYLKELGVDMVWTSPIYESPDKDMGYDISDYYHIAERYGTLEDVDRLIAELKKRDMKLIMDLVANHTSDQHAWFKESRTSTSSKKRDWYIWRKPKKDAQGQRKPPNNWVSFFGGSAWNYDEASGEYYLCLFTKEQPDLNWENEDVREGVYDIMRFWLDRGAWGFRMDVINEISKQYVDNPQDPDHPDLPDALVTEPDAEYQTAHTMFCNGPRVHEFLREMHEKVLSKYEHYTVGEVPHIEHPNIMLKYVNPERHELKTCFSFDMHDVDGDQQWPLKPKKFDLVEFKKVINKWQTFYHAKNGWMANYQSNHDQSRGVSRWTSDAPQHRKQAAKLLAMLQVGQSGTQFIYQGQEIGMKNVPKDWPIEEYLDVATINFYNYCKDLSEAGKPAPGTPEEVKQWAQLKARDNARTPVQWTAESQAGFTTGKPWMRVQEEDAKAGWNAEAQSKDPLSVLSFWKKLLILRKEETALIYGNFNLLLPKDPHMFAFVRNLKDKTSFLILLNFSDQDKSVTLRSDEVMRAQSELGEFKSAPPFADLTDWKFRSRFILGNYQEELNWIDSETLSLRPYEGVYFALQ
ncbi:hypothetical protein CBS101457_005123 [Exobasidium rhododendri]|nr:hypothetical protein CBS101457_005123 [Exobasidium rhododendri]